MCAEAPSFKELNTVPSSEWTEFGINDELNSNPFLNVIDNFYQTDVISRSSPTMAKCTEEFILNKKKERLGNG